MFIYTELSGCGGLRCRPNDVRISADLYLADNFTPCFYPISVAFPSIDVAGTALFPYPDARAEPQLC